MLKKDLDGFLSNLLLMKRLLRDWITFSKKKKQTHTQKKKQVLKYWMEAYGAWCMTKILYSLARVISMIKNNIVVHFPDTRFFNTKYPVTCKGCTGYHVTSKTVRS